MPHMACWLQVSFMLIALSPLSASFFDCLPHHSRPTCALQGEFLNYKLQLIEKETKKRMLEELWADQVEIDPEIAKQAENDMKAKKAAVTELKRENQKRREALREQAIQVANGVAVLREREEALAATMQKVEERNAEADELRSKTQSRASETQRAKEQLAESSAALEGAKAQCEQLTQRLAALHKQVAEENAATASLAAEGDGVSMQLSQLRQQAEAQAAASGEVNHVNAIVKTLAGVKSVVATSADGTSLRYELAMPFWMLRPGSRDQPPSLLVRFEPESGALKLAGLAVEPSGLVEASFLAALEAHARRTDSVEAAVRELQAYIQIPPEQRVDADAAFSSSAARANTTTALAPFGSAHHMGSVQHFGTAARATPFAGRPTPMKSGGAAAAQQSATFSSSFQQPPAASPAPGLLPVADLSSRMAGAAAPSASGSTPVVQQPTPGKWSSALGSGPAPMDTAAPKGTAVPMDIEPTPSAAFKPTKALPRTPAAGAGSSAAAEPHGCASGASSVLPSPRKTDYKADTVPRSEYRPPVPTSASGPMPLALAGVRVEVVDADAIGAIGARRDGVSGGKKPPRKSFVRSVVHPRSPCSRAARAGIDMNPKSAISELLGAGGPGEKAKPLQRVFAAVDSSGQLRASLMDDASVIDARGELLAYIEENGQVGDQHLDFIGDVTPANGASIGFVTNTNDELIAEVDYGLGRIREPGGSTIASITRIGEVRGHSGSYCGKLEGFDFSMMRRAAAYLTLVDCAFLEGK